MVTYSESTVFTVTLAGDASAVRAYLGNIQSRSTLSSFPFTEAEAKGRSNSLELLVLDPSTLVARLVGMLARPCFTTLTTKESLPSW